MFLSSWISTINQIVLVKANSIIVVKLTVPKEFCHVLKVFAKIWLLLWGSSLCHKQVDFLHCVDNLLLKIEMICNFQLQIASIQKLIVCVWVLNLHVQSIWFIIKPFNRVFQRIAYQTCNVFETICLVKSLTQFKSQLCDFDIKLLQLEVILAVLENISVSLVKELPIFSDDLIIFLLSFREEILIEIERRVFI